jgi:hypothetical protein
VIRVQQEAPLDRLEVLGHLARAVSPDEVFVQVGASVEWPTAIDTYNIEAQIGLLHLGEGRHEVFEIVMPYLAKGATILMEGYSPDSPVYTYATGWAARGYLSSLVEARYWKGLGLATYLGRSR